MRAARGLLRWSADDLANHSRLGVATIRRAESVDGVPKSTEANLAAIRAALEAAGVELINGTGVKLRRLRVGDKVRLRAGTLLWGENQRLRDQIAEVVAIVDDGTPIHRVSIAYDGVMQFEGIDAGLLDLTKVE